MTPEQARLIQLLNEPPLSRDLTPERIHYIQLLKDLPLDKALLPAVDLVMDRPLDGATVTVIESDPRDPTLDLADYLASKFIALEDDGHQVTDIILGYRDIVEVVTTLNATSRLDPNDLAPLIFGARIWYASGFPTLVISRGESGKLIVVHEPSPGLDLYEVLGVERNADETTIKRAYRESIKGWLPEDGYDSAGQRLVRAFQILSNRKARKSYDSLGYAAYESLVRHGVKDVVDGAEADGPKSVYDQFCENFEGLLDHPKPKITLDKHSVTSAEFLAGSLESIARLLREGGTNLDPQIEAVARVAMDADTDITGVSFPDDPHLTPDDVVIAGAIERWYSDIMSGGSRSGQILATIFAEMEVHDLRVCDVIIGDSIYIEVMIDRFSATPHGVGLWGAKVHFIPGCPVSVVHRPVDGTGLLAYVNRNTGIRAFVRKTPADSIDLASKWAEEMPSFPSQKISLHSGKWLPALIKEVRRIDKDDPVVACFMHALSYSDLRQFGRDLLDTECMRDRLKKGHMGCLPGGLPIYVNLIIPRGFFVRTESGKYHCLNGVFSI